MAYFSLLYQSEQEEMQMKESAKKQLFVNERKVSERVFKLVGNRMVQITDASNSNERKLPSCFIDLNINQIMDRILLEDSDDFLTEIFYELIYDKALIIYRQDIFKDLEEPLIYDSIQSFHYTITQVLQRMAFANQADHPIQKSKYLLDAIDFYQSGILNLIHALETQALSAAFHQLLCILKEACEESSFINMRKQAIALKQQIENIYYNLTLSGDRIRLSFGCKEDDYCDELRRIFSCRSTNERTANSTDYTPKNNQISFFHQIHMNELELKIVDIISRKYDDLFKECMDFTLAHPDFINPMIIRIHKELKFYLLSHDYICKLMQKNFSLTYPFIIEDNYEGSDTTEYNDISDITDSDVMNYFVDNNKKIDIINSNSMTEITNCSNTLDYANSNCMTEIAVNKNMTNIANRKDRADKVKHHSIMIRNLYDINLAFKAEAYNEVILNDFVLNTSESGAWITGANQGGKTTYARSLGQIAYLTLLGLPVPATYAKVPLFTNILTHFTAEEDAAKSNGKLQEELLHIKEMMDQAPSGKSLFILNELFSSATSSDAYDMSKLLIHRLREAGHMVICVTHIPSLADDSDGMASLGTQTADSPNHERTYHIIRKKAELTAYAFTIAKKYHLTLAQIKERMGYENQLIIS